MALEGIPATHMTDEERKEEIKTQKASKIKQQKRNHDTG